MEGVSGNMCRGLDGSGGDLGEFLTDAVKESGDFACLCSSLVFA